MKSKETKDTLSKHRLEALLDGVFAIAMTILVLNIDAPAHLNISEPGALSNALQKMIPTFFNYVISFLILASFIFFISPICLLILKTDFIDT
ncbi:hypothetical protein ES708_33448 [subsurface metagenome]